MKKSKNGNNCSNSNSSKSNQRRRRRNKPNRALLFLYNRLIWPCLAADSASGSTTTNRFGMKGLVGCFVFLAFAVLFVAYTSLWMFRHAQCYSREAGIIWKEAPIHDMHRPCPRGNLGYKTLSESWESNVNNNTNSGNNRQPRRICMTTLTDKKSSSTSLWQRVLRCRDFDQVATLTWPNHARYAQLHNYTIFDASNLMDTSRPPAWSKIRAVLHLLDQKTTTTTTTAATSNSGRNAAVAAAGEQQRITINACDWVLWLDADVVIMNSSIALESILPADDDDDAENNNNDNNSMIDLIVTMDRRFTANSGVWLIRNSNYSKHFLHTWWDMRTWVREPGLSLSGDNAAFGHLIEQELLLNPAQQQHHHQQQHVAMIPRCIMNSFGAFVTPTELEELQKNTAMLQQHEFELNSQNYYHAGDFIAHASGIDQKAAAVKMLLDRIDRNDNEQQTGAVSPRGKIRPLS
jgi:galactosyl transferase GMA12/MNN10 family